MNINNLIDNFIKKILEDNSETLDEKINFVNILLDNLIDYCIKKKIYYYIENEIKYSDIINLFKNELFNYIKNLIDPDDNIISKYIEDDYEKNNFDNFSDINSLIFTKYKNSNKTKVNFNDNICIINDGEIEYNNNFNKKYLLDSRIDEINNINNKKKLPLYIKLLISQNKHIIEFIEKLNLMCEMTSNSDIIFNTTNPFNSNNL